MSAAVCRSDHQRAVGVLRLSVRDRDGTTVLDGLRQQGCLKARFPRAEVGAWTTAVTLNISGGIAGGDRLDSAISVGPGARLTIAGQAAERFYRALPGSAPASVQTNIEVAANAAAEWLPQEAILFDGCALDRRLSVELDKTAEFLGVEAWVLGRAAMGEQVRALSLRDTIRIRRDGRLVLHDAIRLAGDTAPLAATAAAGGMRAFATLIHTGPDAPVDALRATLALPGVEAGVSAWDGITVARLVARDGACLRAAIVGALTVLRPGRPLPGVWLC